MRTSEKSSTLPVSEAGSLRVAVVADTHSKPHRDLEKHLRALQPSAIVHAGDIGDLVVLDELAKVAPVFAVRGNIDGHGPEIPDVRVLDIAAASRLVLRVFVTHIGVNGPRLRREVAQQARARGASLVICGHSHVPFIGRDGSLSVFNPGSAGPRRFTLPIVFGVMEISTQPEPRVRLRHVDCETGETWSPDLAIPRVASR